MGSTLLLMFAFVFFVIASFFGPNPATPQSPWYGRFNLVSIGLAAWSLSELVKSWPAHL
jgi:hypothetical protein